MTLRKRILTMGPLTHPQRSGQIIDIDDEFVSSLQRNLSVMDCTPMVRYNSHTEDPMYRCGEVTGIVVDGDEVFTEFELDQPLDLSLFDAVAMIIENYLDTRTGEKVGPALIHVLLKGKPVVLGPSGL